MAVAALIAWLLTAAGGFYLLSIWIAKGGSRRTGSSHLPPGVMFGHLGLAVGGLLVWIGYLLTGRAGLAWTALVLLLPVAALGFLMLARWIPTYRAHAAVPAGHGASRGAAADAPAERHFPVVVVGAHGVLATVTLVLVLVAAMGAG